MGELATAVSCSIVWYVSLKSERNWVVGILPWAKVRSFQRCEFVMPVGLMPVCACWNWDRLRLVSATANLADEVIFALGAHKLVPTLLMYICPCRTQTKES